MAVMRQTSCERWAIVERILGSALGQLQTRLEGIDLAPELDDLLFLLRKVELGADWKRDQRDRRVRSESGWTHDRVVEKA